MATALSQYGQISNFIGLLDSSKTQVKRDKFFEIAEAGKISKTDLAKQLKVSRPKLYKSEFVRIKESDIKKRILPFVIIADLAYELFDKDEQKTIEWLMTPNQVFFNESPFNMAMGQKGDVVIEKLEEWSR